MVEQAAKDQTKKVGGDLHLTLTNCANAWTATISAHAQPQVESSQDKSMVHLVNRYLCGSQGVYRIVRSGDNLRFVIEYNRFALAQIDLIEASLSGVLQKMLKALLGAEKEMRRLRRKEEEMKETIDQLAQTIEARVDTEIKIQDELALQFLQVLNRKKAFNAKLQAEIDRRKREEKEKEKEKEKVEGEGPRMKKRKMEMKRGMEKSLSDVEEEEEEEEEEDDAMFSQFHG